ncbi:unnamed protein product, partial [marine sediment metagenome]
TGATKVAKKLLPCHLEKKWLLKLKLERDLNVPLKPYPKFNTSTLTTKIIIINTMRV